MPASYLSLGEIQQGYDGGLLVVRGVSSKHQIDALVILGGKVKVSGFLVV